MLKNESRNLSLLLSQSISGEKKNLIDNNKNICYYIYKLKIYESELPVNIKSLSSNSKHMSKFLNLPISQFFENQIRKIISKKN